MGEAKKFREIFLDETRGFQDLKGLENALNIGAEHPLEELKSSLGASPVQLERYTVCQVGETVIACREDLLELIYSSFGSFGEIPPDNKGRVLKDPRSDKKTIFHKIRRNSEAWFRKIALQLLEQKAS